MVKNIYNAKQNPSLIGAILIQQKILYKDLDDLSQQLHKLR